MFSYLLTAFGTILFIWLIQYHWKRRRLYRFAAKREGPRDLPIIGSALYFMGSNEDILMSYMNIMEKYKSAAPVWLGQRLFFTISSPEHLEVILNHLNSLEKEDLYKFVIPCVGKSLLTAPVSLWKKHRKMIMPTFNQKNLDGFVEIFQEQSLILENQLDKVTGKEDFDIFPYFSLFALDAICETAMGVKINAQTTDEPLLHVLTAMEIAFNRMFAVWQHNDFVFNMTSLAGEFKENCYKMRSFTSDVIRKKRDIYQREKLDRSEDQFDTVPQRRNTFLQQTLELSEEEDHLTDTEILNEVTLLMIAGSETTASTNSFTMMMLGMHPDIQEKVYNEVIDAIGNDKPVEYKDLPKLPYTEMVIKETMRLFPAVPLIARKVTGDIELEENVVLPGGSSLAVCIVYVHRDPKIWRNPLLFDPLRFLPEECAKRHPYSYLPFSGGPRNCIGLKYAMMAMKTVIATIVRKYHIKCTREHVADIKIKQDLVVKPVGGYGVSLEKRNKIF